MDCNEAALLISADLDGEGDESARDLLRDHLAGCASCRELSDGVRRQDADLLRAFRPRRRAAEALAERVIARLPAGRRSRWSPFAWGPVLLAAAAGFLVAVVIFQAIDKTNPPGGRSLNTGIDGILDAFAAKLAYATGSVEVREDEKSPWKPLAAGAGVPAGARIRTGPRVLCELETPDGSSVRLNAGTELLISSPRQLELAAGQMWSSVAHTEEPFVVKVPRAQAAVTAVGTAFDVRCSEAAEAVLTVVEGSTRVSGKGKEEMVQLGERAHISGGAITKRMKVRDVDLATSWVNEILALRGPEDAEFTRRLNVLFAQIGEVKMKDLSEKEIVSLGDHCVLPLTRFIQSDLSKDDKRTREEAARILQKVASGWSVPLLIDLLEDKDGEVRFWAAKALERLADGETQGIRAEGWRTAPAAQREEAHQRWLSWWKVNQDLFPNQP